MKVRFQIHALNEALATVAIVPPRSVSAEAGGAGYLFVCKDKECAIYSREQRHQIRVSVPVEDVDGDGSFIFPADKVAALRYLEGWIEIEAGNDDDRFWVRYEAESKDKQEDISSVDPKMMRGLDDELAAASEGIAFPAALLKEALNTSRSYMTKPDDGRVEEVFQTLQIFDDSKEEWKRGNGFMFAADGVRTCYFYCDKFEGKRLGLHGHNLSFVLSFLGKCQGDVQLRHGKGMSFLVNSAGHVLAWAHNVKEHSKFAYYALGQDGFVLRIDKGSFVKALKYVRAAYDAKKDKARLEYDHAERTLKILASEGKAKAISRPVPVTPVEPTEQDPGGAKALTEGFGYNVNLNYLIDLIEPMRGHQVDLRVAVRPAKAGKKDAALFRTIDSFILDADGKPLISAQDAGAEDKAAKCQVTRYMPSRD